MIGKIALVLALTIAGLAYYNANQVKYGVTVRSKTGSVRGIVKTSRDGREFYGWLGIPFAQPPVGKLRFADPVPVHAWKGIHDGSQYGKPCAQISFFSGYYTGDEDCLYLNIYTPKIEEGDFNHQKKLPVIVYIHGGAYILGEAITAGPDYFMDEDVVFVTIAYRLGILGFLTTGEDKVVRGNMGLKDQTMALKWVKDNIEHFGGDPNQITIFGTSAGGASVHQQTLSKLSKGLFQRAYSQSGAASNQWGFIDPKKSLKNLEAVAERLNCPKTTNVELVQCLRQLDAKQLIYAEEELFNSKLSLFTPYTDGLGFVPTIEAIDDGNAFIAEHPLKIIAKGQAHGVPHLIGHTSDEGIFSSLHFRKDEGTLRVFEENWKSLTRQLFQLPDDLPDEVVEKVFEIYMPRSLQSKLSIEERLNNYTKLFGDAFFNFDIREAVNLQRKYSPVYYYMYCREPSPVLMHSFYYAPKDWPKVLGVTYGLLKYLVKNALGLTQTSYGLDHAMDVVLQLPFKPLVFLGKDSEFYELSKDHVRMAVDFAKDDRNVVVRGTKFKPLEKTGTLHVIEIKDQVRIVREVLEERMQKLHALDIRGVNKLVK